MKAFNHLIDAINKLVCYLSSIKSPYDFTFLYTIYFVVKFLYRNPSLKPILLSFLYTKRNVFTLVLQIHRLIIFMILRLHRENIMNKKKCFLQKKLLVFSWRIAREHEVDGPLLKHNTKVLKKVSTFIL